MTLRTFCQIYAVVAAGFVVANTVLVQDYTTAAIALVFGVAFTHIGFVRKEAK